MQYFSAPVRFATMRCLGLVVVAVLCAPHAARACKLVKFRSYSPSHGTPAGPPPRIDWVIVTATHSMPPGCGLIGGVSIRLHAADQPDVRGYGLRLRLLEGTFPYRLPGEGLEIWENRVAHYEFESLPPYPAWRARLAGAIVGPDGQQGPWFEFDAADDGLFAPFYLWGWFWPFALIVLAVHVYVCRRIARRNALRSRSA